MNRIECPVPDEKWVEWIRGTMPESEGAELSAHAESCPACRAAYREWSALLADTAEPSQAERPTETFRRKLRLKVAGLALLRRIKPPGAPVIAAALALALALGVWSVPRSDRGGSAGSAVPTAEETVLRDMSMVRDLRTVQLQVMPVREMRIKGVAWVNDVSSEVMLLVEGLVFDDEKDYQVWSVAAGTHTTIGVMRWTNGKAHMYYRGGALSSADNIAVSAEPKGGSVRPTGPDLAVVRLKK
ncbi:anti-sigma factor domain-containing protein [Paenibacillus flagellatus]|uniref:Anti-sigma-W factor RsiW n=1 Tax=Paenibacillus flagellatus TaxID=2211139 RepID=A0A2V5K6V7_9BACL|nr:anti-sigma factor [Paenibacillus flagellatus]PYI55018.1 hypothetical protein DLM86_10785 [Paenibacillus flagellatus]